MPRAIILLLDSLGIGALPDADKFGDTGANTLLHIIEACANGQADTENVRKGPLHIPNLTRLGLLNALTKCTANVKTPEQNSASQVPEAAYGCAAEKSLGKDTPSGHWEIAGVPVLFEWGYFPPEYPSFPKELVTKFISQAKVPGILGNCHSSGTEIIKKFGDEHVASGKPICYTSADSVFQIAAHEEAFGLDRLYELCKIAYELVKPYNIGRVIARPFLGTNGDYYRTEHRRDYSVLPPAPTLLDKLANNQGHVIAIGKVSDIFAAQGITKKVEAHGNDELFVKTLDELNSAPDNSLIFTNFVDFDMKYGHRRDIVGYAKALEDFDAEIPKLEKLLQPDDIVIITADHGCDPTFKGTDHTREYIPVVMFGPKITPRFIGKRETFSDIGQTLAKYFNLEPLEYGVAFLE